MSAKLSRQLRARAGQLLAAPEEERPRALASLLDELERCGEQQRPAYTLAVESVLAGLLRARAMYVEVEPLRPAARTPEAERRDALRSLYERGFAEALRGMESASPRVQSQALSTSMALLSHEGRFPSEPKGELDNHVPMAKLKAVLMRLLSGERDNSQLVDRFREYLSYDDVLFFTWKALPSLTAKSKPNDVYIMNYLSLLEKLDPYPNPETRFLCSIGDGRFFTFDKSLPTRNLNKVWQCVMHWEHSLQTHKRLLIVLLERVLSRLDRPLLLTDFLMDSLDVGGPIGLLALQGVFTLIQSHNLTYPNLFGKLYSMFEPEIFHTKYKARLFYLADMFLSSTHLPEGLVAAFVKRLARLALVAPSEDVVVICQFIGNLILRHPGLKRLLDHPGGPSPANADPYVADERDPMKSNAAHSSLWELETLRRHALPGVATAARFIADPLPSVEWDVGSRLGETGDDLFDREIRRLGKPMTFGVDGGASFGELWNL